MSPNAAVAGCESGSSECALIPAKKPRARGPRNASRASADAGSPARIPNRANASGCDGTPSGARMSGTIASQSRASGPKMRAYRRASGPSVAPVSSTERSSNAAVPSSNGCASAAGDSIHSTPSSASGTVRKKGDATPSGWIAEQTSCA